MKILLGYLSKKVRGGVTFQLNFASHFKHSQVGFLTSNSEIEYADKVAEIGKIHQIPPSRKFFKRLSELKKLSKEYDIIYINRPTLNPFELITYKLTGFRVIVLHSHSAGKDVKNPLLLLLYLSLHYLSRPFVKSFSDLRYACSAPAGDWLFGKRKKPIYKIINNGIDVEKFRFNLEMRGKIREELSLKGETILHVGAFSPVKNQNYLIDAFAEFHKTHPDSSLLFVGDGEYLEECKQKAFSYNLGNAIRFLGYRNDVNNIMQGADLFVLPSTLEGLPFVAMEAQAAGLPCLVTDVATPAVKVTEHCGFIDVKQPAFNLAEKMTEYISLVRRDTADDVISAGFDLTNCAIELEKELEDTLISKGV